MVVNRKQPVAPAPVISRSSSTQPVPTKRPQLKNATRPPPPSRTPPPAAKKKPKRKKSLIDRLFLYSLSLFALYAFYTCRPNPLFSAQSPSHANPLCHSLSSYRVHILEPYVVPPIKHALTFSHTLAEPYIESTKVRVDPYIAPVVRTVSTLKLYLIHTAQSLQALWEGTLVPLYRNTLKPYYQTAVVPRYNLYIHPHIQPLAHKAEHYYIYYVSRPLHIQAIKTQRYIRAKYTIHIQPYILRVEPHARNILNTVQTVTLQLVDTYQTRIHPHLVATWIKVRPALCTGYKHTKKLTLQFADVSSKQIKKATKEASGYRRTYVDPQVRKIWDKVAEGTELSSAPTSTPPLAQDLPDTEESVESIPEPTPVVLSSLSSNILTTTSGEPEAESTELPHASVPTPEEAAEDITHVGMRTAPPPPVDVPSSPAEDAKRNAEHALDVAEASAHGATMAVQDLEREVEERLHVHPDYVHQSHDTPLSASATDVADAAESTAATPEPATTDAPAPTPEEEAEVLLTSATTIEEDVTSKPESTPVTDKIEPVVMYAAEAASPSGAADEEDLDDFLRDLGVEGQATSAVDASSPTGINLNSQQQLTPEEVERARVERLADTATKRADIVGRHNSWFVKLDEAIKEAGPALANALDAWRSEKKAELVKMSGKTGEGNGILDEIQKEGKRLLKGLETYLKKAEARSAAWKLSAAPSDDPEAQAKKEVAVAEKDKWKTVLSKAEGKFTDRVRAIQAQVHQWYVDAMEHERQEVEASAASIKQVAERAQADIGLDYAWLDDVTYHDWQRYHDLMRTFERYEHVAYAIQNGTSADPPSPPAPLVPALDTLHNELQDIVLGFSVALGGLRSEAAKVFSQRTDAEDDDGFFVVNDGQVRKDDLRGVDLGKLGLASGVAPVPSGDEGDEVRILPIDPVDIPKEGENVVDASTVVIGKDPVQIQEALKDVPLEPASVRHEEL